MTERDAPGPVLETDRLTLRALTLDDVDGLLEIFGDARRCGPVRLDRRHRQDTLTSSSAGIDG